VTLRALAPAALRVPKFIHTASGSESDSLDLKPFLCVNRCRNVNDGVNIVAAKEMC
jgi:hypothetical protein